MQKRILYAMQLALPALLIGFLPIPTESKILIMFPLTTIATAIVGSMHETSFNGFVSLTAIACVPISLGITLTLGTTTLLCVILFAFTILTLWSICLRIIMDKRPKIVLDFAIQLHATTGMTTLALPVVIGIIMLTCSPLEHSYIQLLLVLVLEFVVVLAVLLRLNRLFGKSGSVWWKTCTRAAGRIAGRIYDDRKEKGSIEIITTALWKNSDLRASENNPHSITNTNVHIIYDLSVILYSLIYNKRMPVKAVEIPQDHKVFMVAKLSIALGYKMEVLKDLRKFKAYHNNGEPTAERYGLDADDLQLIRWAETTHGPEVVWEMFVLKLLKLIDSTPDHEPDHLKASYANLLAFMKK